jgi:hypothetical protein
MKVCSDCVAECIGQNTSRQDNLSKEPKVRRGVAKPTMTDGSCRKLDTRTEKKR